VTREIEPTHARLVAGRAMTLIERLDQPTALQERAHDEETVTEVLSAWRDQFPSEAAFERRLASLDVDEADCRRAVRADQLADSEPFPEWVDRLDALVADTVGEQSATVSATREQLQWDDDAGVMFPALSARLAAVAVDRLPERVHERVSSAVVREAAQWFRRRFHRRFDRVLFVEFKKFVAAHDEDRAFADPEAFDDPPTEYYDQYHTFLFDQRGFGDVCVEYPVFARLLATQLDQWVSHLTEVVDRLDADQEALAERFGDGQLAKLTEIEPLADDTHGDGRAVTKLSFDCGTQIVYKPRPVTAGERFYELLTDLNDHLSVPDFESPTYLDRGSYGWMEWVDDEDCADEAAVERYYERAGALIAVTHLTAFTDCHHENLVANGEHPTLVDAETVFHPRFGADRRADGHPSQESPQWSILSSSLLPRASGGDDDIGGIVSGIAPSAAPEPIPGVTVPQLEAAGSDVVDVAEQDGEVQREANVPAVEGEPVLPDGCVDRILEGVREAHETVVSLSRDDRLDLEERFSGVENRLVYRPTMEYARLINGLQSGQVLSDGAQVTVELAQLTAGVCDTTVDDPPWGVVAAERTAVRQFDPPRFASRVDGTELWRNGERTGETVARSGLSVARERLRTADRTVSPEQTEIVRGAFDGPLTDDRTETPLSACAVPDAATRRAAAVAAWNRIEEAAVWADGVPHWEWIGPWEGDDTLQIQRADESLYFGRPGIALLPAALYRVTGDDEFRSAAQAVVEPTQAAVDTPGRRGIAELGGTRGVGAAVYGLAVLGELLDDDDLLDGARTALDSLSEEAVNTDRTYDVTAGSAGTILGLLGAESRVSGDPFDRWARRCGDHLLDRQRPTDAGGAAWDTGVGESPLTGFAHGSSGIAYALARLSAATDDGRYERAVGDALAYERAVYDPDHRNWPDFRAENTGFADQWCHGRTGVVLARLGIADSLDVTQLGEPDAVTRAVESVTEPSRVGDHLCCGVAGRVELSVEARRRDWSVPSAGSAVGRLVERVHSDAGLVDQSNTHHIQDPSLFCGLAGVGYTLLRTEHPETLPSVLLWE